MPYHRSQRYALMPSFTARPIPHRLTITRNGPAGTFLAIFVSLCGMGLAVKLGISAYR